MEKLTIKTNFYVSDENLHLRKIVQPKVWVQTIILLKLLID